MEQRIWWEHITKASYFMHSVTDALLDGKSVVLSMPHFVPWQDTFQEMVEDILRQENAENSLDCIECPEEPAGKYLLEHYCKKEKRAAYRCGMSYGEFLAGSPDIVLHHRYLWVRNMPKKAVNEWLQFIAEYQKYLEKDVPQALFILETSDTVSEKNIRDIQEIRFDNIIHPYDVFTFCILLCSEMQMRSSVRSYLAELVSNICGNDIELCAKSIRKGKHFLSNPLDSLKEIIQTEVHSDGRPFELDSEPEIIENKIWESQIKMLFPIIERYRSKFIKQYYQEVSASLPVKNSLGQVIDSPQDVELGMLVQLVGKKSLFLDDTAYRELKMFRTARNDLAHLRTVDYAISEQILHHHD